MLCFFFGQCNPTGPTVSQRKQLAKNPCNLTGDFSLNVAKCNLGKVNLEAMLARSFPAILGVARCH